MDGSRWLQALVDDAQLRERPSPASTSHPGAAALLLVLAAGWSGCGGGSKIEMGGASACLSCAMNACPTQAAACDASPGCKALRACSLACRSAMLPVRTPARRRLRNDSTAILAGRTTWPALRPRAPTNVPVPARPAVRERAVGRAAPRAPAGKAAPPGPRGQAGPAAASVPTATAKLTSCGAAWTGRVTRPVPRPVRQQVHHRQ
jgi:hypothetical protein